MSTKEKLEKGIYSLDYAPRIMELSFESIFINKNCPYPNEVESLENMDWQRDQVLTHKLKATSYGDWGMDIAIINTKHFESREKLDEMFIADLRPDIRRLCQNIKRISFQKALDYTGVQISINMDFYLKNKNELESDLMRQVSDLDLKNENSRKKIEQELFYNLMFKIFGEDDKAAAEDNLDKKEDDYEELFNSEYLFEKAFILNEFHKYLDGNYMYATARRGDYYLLINHVF